MLLEAASKLLSCHDQVRQVEPSEWQPPASLDQAAAIQQAIAQQRVARGENRIGYKIGFTNRTIWQRYQVNHPISGPVYDSTVQLLDDTDASVDASQFSEARLEPEIVVCIRQTPDDATPASIGNSLAWVAHGIEIVQSPFEGWRFTGAEAMAAQGLHGALLIGPRIEPGALTTAGQELAEWLSGISVSLFVDTQSEPVERGQASNVLDGPLHAVAYLMDELAKRGQGLSAGDVITTGTITDAMPIRNGQQWQTRLENAGRLSDLRLTVAAAGGPDTET